MSSIPARIPAEFFEPWSATGPCAFLTGPFAPADEDLLSELHHLPPSSQKLRIGDREGLLRSYPTEPRLHAQHAWLLYGLKDVHGALEHAEEAQRLMGRGTDQRFDVWVEKVRARTIEAEFLAKEEHRLQGNDMYSLGVLPIDAYSTSPSWNTLNIRSDWSDAKSILGDADRDERYSRLLCISTNELEDVFRLGGASMDNLMRAGFYQAAVQHDHTSAVKDKSRTIKILEETQQALNFIAAFAGGPRRPMEVADIIRIHRELLNSSRIISINDGASFRVLPVGRLRQQVVCVYRAPHHARLVFHAPDQLEASMQSFVDLFAPLVRRIQDQPSTFSDAALYNIAAWAHHCLISIHPFLDGNGRMTRIVASIPLVLGGLPPIGILLEDRGIYHAALNRADDGDPRDLAAALALCSRKSLAKLVEVGPANDDDTLMAYNDTVLEGKTSVISWS